MAKENLLNLIGVDYAKDVVATDQKECECCGWVNSAANEICTSCGNFLEC